MDKNLEKFNNDQLCHYERIAVEQTKTARAKSKMEKSVAAHAYQMEQLRHANAVDELNRARSNRLLTISSIVCGCILSMYFIYHLFF